MHAEFEVTTAMISVMPLRNYPQLLERSVERSTPPSGTRTKHRTGYFILSRIWWKCSSEDLPYTHRNIYHQFSPPFSDSLYVAVGLFQVYQWNSSVASKTISINCPVYRISVTLPVEGTERTFANEARTLCGCHENSLSLIAVHDQPSSCKLVRNSTVEVQSTLKPAGVVSAKC